MYKEPERKETCTRTPKGRRHVQGTQQEGDRRTNAVQDWSPQEVGKATALWNSNAPQGKKAVIPTQNRKDPAEKQKVTPLCSTLYEAECHTNV